MKTGFKENNIDLGDLYVTKDYIIDVYSDLDVAIKTPALLLVGNNQYGQLGNLSVISKSSPVQTIIKGTDWKQVSSGGNHTAAIKTDGTLWIWGYNNVGQLGINSFTNKSSPIQTAVSGTDWKQVSCGLYHTAAIKTDGTLWVWGYNVNGELGDGTTQLRSLPVQTAVSGTDWKQVSCGNDNTAAIKTDGTLWVWGYNSNGQLGDNTTIAKSSPIQTAVSGTDWKQVSSHLSMAAIKTDGTLWVWGRNLEGQLGDNTTIAKSSPIQTAVSGTDWKQVSSNGFNSAAIKTDGTLWICGSNTFGILGDNTTINQSSPIQTAVSGTDWKYVSCNGTNTAAIKTDGTLWTWGYNLEGQLGDNTVINQSSPIQIIINGVNWKQIDTSRLTVGIIEVEGW